MEITDRKKEVINICLETFISKGLSETSVRDLGKAIKSSTSGIYYYFDDKDSAVIACAEEAAERLEENLILPTFRELNNPDKMMKRLRSRADEMTPYMKFFASVCALSKYDDRIKPVLDTLAVRYERYAERYAVQLQCPINEVAPYVYLMITLVSNYMIFGESCNTRVQVDFIKNRILRLLERKQSCQTEGENRL